MAEQWQFAEGVWIPKEEGDELVQNLFIANIEGKIFFTIQLGNFLSNNSNIGT